MITFLPYPDFKQSAKVLDNVRLQSQVLEAKILLDAVLANPTNQPAVQMWKGYPRLLAEYGAEMAIEWGRRFNKRHEYMALFLRHMEEQRRALHPPSWLGREQLHSSHRARLHEKDPVHYALFAEDKVKIFCCPGCAYWWPTHRMPQGRSTRSVSSTRRTNRTVRSPRTRRTTLARTGRSVPSRSPRRSGGSSATTWTWTDSTRSCGACRR